MTVSLEHVPTEAVRNYLKHAEENAAEWRSDAERHRNNLRVAELAAARTSAWIDQCAAELRNRANASQEHGNG